MIFYNKYKFSEVTQFMETIKQLDKKNASKKAHLVFHHISYGFWGKTLFAA